MLEQLAVVLVPAARLVVRLFVAPEPGEIEAVEDVIEAAECGAIGTFHAFKWRLAHALTARRGDANVPVAYRTSRTAYCFPTLTAFRAGLPPGWTIEAVSTGQYELAERCPVMVLRHG